jgi:competence protein ComEC
LGIAAAFAMPRVWRSGPRWQVWLSIGLAAIIALVYLEIRLPRPAPNDISQILTAKYPSQFVSVTGKVITEGRTTANQRVRFLLAAETVKQGSKKDSAAARKVKGKLYVTVPPTVGKAIYPGQKVAVRGVLYRPSATSNPGSFNFKAYLAREGAFAGLKGFTLKKWGEPPWGLWAVRRRIVDAQVAYLGIPEGLLVSSMVVGQQSVDLPPEIRHRSGKTKLSQPIKIPANFRKAGLTHIVAVSGFQVSLLLGASQIITNSFSLRIRFNTGLIVLIFYIALTGFQPSALRAGMMGLGVLIGLVTDRKVRPLGALLLAGTLLLIWNPLWIWDLGFQLSFLATFGLLVTLPALQQKLDWLPPTLATIIALPIAASLWTLPLLMHAFSFVAIYTIPVNILVAPLVIAISLGGFVSATVALIFPPAGGAIAWLLYYPTHWLIQLVNLVAHLPASSYAIGKLSLGLMVLIYLLMLLTWASLWWQKRWQLVGLAIIALVIVPIVYSRLTLIQVTVLDTKSNPAIVIQERGTVTLIDSGDEQTAQYTILPFLTQQGINYIDAGIAFQSVPKPMVGWSEIEANLKIGKFFSNFPVNSEKFQQLSLEEKLSVGKTNIELISAKPPVLQLQIQRNTWLLLTTGKLPEILPQFPDILTPQVLLWAGRRFSSEWLNIISPKVAISVAHSVDAATRKQLEDEGIDFYWTGRDGAIQWTPQGGFEKALEESNYEL